MRKQLDGSSQDTADSTLVQQSLAGDHAAFETLVERYSAPLVDYLSRQCRDESLVQDMVQHALVQLYVSLPLLRAHLPLKPWLLRVAHNRYVDECRRRELVPFSQLALACQEQELPFFDTLPDPDLLPEEQVERQESRRRIQWAIRALPPRQRGVVWMRYADQLSYAEIARRLHISESTAKASFFRARPLLRRLLADEIEPRTPSRKNA